MARPDMDTADRQLLPYRPEVDGPWDAAAAAHLVRRAAFGAPERMVARALELGPEKAVEEIFSPAAANEDIELIDDVAMRLLDIEAAQAWWFYRMLYGSRPAREKLALFWHGHFATSNRKVENPRLMMRQARLFQRLGGEPFRDLLLAVARDPAMLIWLDSNSSRRGSPNENFARELMELFSLGIGNYTEEDIKEAARAFTGWHVRHDEFWFNENAHDVAVKTVFGRTGELGGEDVVDLCVEKPACARFIASKLFEFYVGEDPDEARREALGALYRDSGMRTEPFLRRLLSSRAFYAAGARRAIVQSPVDFVAGSLATLGARASARAMARFASRMGQELFEPPTVQGWEGGDAWIHSTALLARYRFAKEVAHGGELGARVPWEELDARGPRAVVAMFFPEGLPPAVEREIIGAAEDGTGVRLAVAGCLQVPEYQYL